MHVWVVHAFDYNSFIKVEIFFNFAGPELGYPPQTAPA